MRALRLRTQLRETPFKFETGTLNHEGIVGAARPSTSSPTWVVTTCAASRPTRPRPTSWRVSTGRRRQIVAGMLAAEAHEQPLARHLIDGLRAIPGVTVYGPPDDHPRTSTVAFTVDGVPPEEVCRTPRRRGPVPLGRPLLRHPPGRAARPDRARRPGARRPRALHDRRARSSACSRRVRPPGHRAPARRDGSQAMPAARHAQASACSASATSAGGSASSSPARRDELARATACGSLRRRGHRSHGSLAGAAPACRPPRCSSVADRGRRRETGAAPGRPAFPEPARPGVELIGSPAAPTCWSRLPLDPHGGRAGDRPPRSRAHRPRAWTRSPSTRDPSPGTTGASPLAAAHGRRLLFEGAVMDGCPSSASSAPACPTAACSASTRCSTRPPTSSSTRWARAAASPPPSPASRPPATPRPTPPTTSTATTPPPRRPPSPPCSWTRVTPDDVPKDAIRGVTAERVAAVRAPAVGCASSARRARSVDRRAAGRGRLGYRRGGRGGRRRRAGWLGQVARACHATRSPTGRAPDRARTGAPPVRGGRLDPVGPAAHRPHGHVQIAEHGALPEQTAYAIYADLLALHEGR